MSYHQFINDETGEAYGSFEVFEENACSNRGIIYRSGTGKWYWWACFPGCLPDGEPIGPFDSEQHATTDATGSEQ